jgi:hypothetical protein
MKARSLLGLNKRLSFMSHKVEVMQASGIREAARVAKNSLIMNNLGLILRKSILTKNDTITQHK